VKVVDLEDATDSLDDIRKEVAVLTQCDCPYITKYYGSFVHDKKLWILLEHLSGGSVADLLQAGGPLTEDEIAVILRDSLQALIYLHSQNRVHRDLKSANILLSSSGEVKLSDFGVSGQLTASVRRLNTFVGSPFWMAPEVRPILLRRLAPTTTN
jgi:serine/threonine-protein kinase 24/25/MST4